MKTLSKYADDFIPEKLYTLADLKMSGFFKRVCDRTGDDFIRNWVRDNIKELPYEEIGQYKLFQGREIINYLKSK